MAYTVTDESGLAVLCLSGELTAHEALQVKEQLSGLMDREVALDFSGVVSVDSAVLQLLHAAHLAWIKAGRRLMLRNLPEAVGRTVKLAGFGGFC